MKYQYCGLVLNTSEIFPELEPADNEALPDIQVHQAKLGSIPAIARAYGPNWAVREGEGWWWLGDRIIFRIRKGEIDIDNRNIEHSLARSLLLEAPMVLAMIFDGIFCLNAASVSHEGKTTVICGAAGSGRSTAAARLALRNGHLITDSLARIQCTEESAKVVPQGSGSLLWPDSLTELDLDAMTGSPIRSELLLRRISLKQATKTQSIDHLYWRNPRSTSHLIRETPTQTLGPRRQFARLATMTAGRMWIDAAGVSTVHFQWCLKAAKQLRISPAPDSLFF